VKYLGQPQFDHANPERIGILMANLGTPDAPQTKEVRRYLAQFLSDPRIIELPRWLWRIILHGIILRTRPAKSAEAYRTVWSDTEGSPLLSISQKQCKALHEALQQRFGDNVVTALGMRYGSPSIDDAISELEEQHARRVIVLPMYPQYSGTTTASVFDAVTQRFQKTRWLPELRFINQYIDEDKYIAALAQSVQKSWQENGQGELLVTSYHGIPRRYLTNGDPYHCQCHKTTRMLREKLGLAEDKVKVVFQSRVGREPWLRPYCDETMKSLPGDGYKSIDIICPGFSADCLETIEEINEENREYFEHAGGERFNYIPCLNDDPLIIEALADLIERHTGGWPEAYSPAGARDDEYRDRKTREEKLREAVPANT